jgi:hypothetical protein
MAAKSYAWGQQLSEPVPSGEDAVVQTPGFDSPENYLTDETAATLDGKVLTPEEFTAAWADDFTSVTVTNGTEAEWQPAQTLYVTVAGTPFDVANIEESFDALAAQVADHEQRIAALEGVPPAEEGSTTTSVRVTKRQPKHEARSKKHK